MSPARQIARNQRDQCGIRRCAECRVTSRDCQVPSCSLWVQASPCHVRWEQGEHEFDEWNEWHEYFFEVAASWCRAPPLTSKFSSHSSTFVSFVQFVFRIVPSLLCEIDSAPVTHSNEQRLARPGSGAVDYLDRSPWVRFISSCRGDRRSPRSCFHMV